MRTEAEDLIIQQAITYVRNIKQRTPITVFKKGMIFNWRGKAYEVLRVNKKSLSVYRLGMKGKSYATDKNYRSYKERRDIISYGELNGRPPYELSRNEAAYLLNAARLYNHKGK